jgi:predicted small integral membrane protein
VKKKLPAVALDFDGSSSSKKKVIPAKTCYNATMLTRLAKIALIASIAFLMTLVALNNVTDYDSNFQFVRHVMSMDTTFPENRLMWRAIISPVWHHIFYLFIIVCEASAAVCCWIGAFACFRARKEPATTFHQAKDFAAAGLSLVLLQFTVAFLSVGAEWFLMWQSPQWNGQAAAFRMIGVTGIVLIFVSLPDTDY